MTNPNPDIPILDDDAVGEIAREAERLPTDYNVIEPLLVRDAYEGREASPWMGHTRPAAEAYASVPALCATVRALRAENERLDNEPRLGCATTRQLLEELMARIEIHHSLDYRTTDPQMKYNLPTGS